MRCVWEHNGNDTLLYSVDHIGAFTRGNSLEAAAAKMNAEIASYSRWKNQKVEAMGDLVIVQEKCSNLLIADADSDVLFDIEKAPLSLDEYQEIKKLVLKSAEDFHSLYASISNKNESCISDRRTFYGNIPRTAQEMYEHTKNVNAYYFAEIGIEADNNGTIYDCRKRGFDRLENTDDFLRNDIVEGSYDELWSVRKMMRRFIWHDRIHAKAMYRMAIKTFGAFGAENIFCFDIS